MPLTGKILQDAMNGSSKAKKILSGTSAKDLSKNGIIGGANTAARTLERQLLQSQATNPTELGQQMLSDLGYIANPNINITNPTPNVSVIPNISNNIDLSGAYDGIASAMNGLSGTLADMYSRYISAQQSAAAYANEQSRLAQEQQFRMNKELMKMSGDFQTQSAKTANEFTQKLFNQAMAYNSNEAIKNRTWQENMSNTAYQRAMADMKKAGLNPILAYQNGGATVGAGATASIGQSTGQSAGSISGSVGNYSGQGYHIDDKFAALGALIGTVGNLLSAYKVGQKGDLLKSKVLEPIEKVVEGVMDTTQKTTNWFIEHNLGYKIGKWYYDKKNSTGGGGGHGF